MGEEDDKMKRRHHTPDQIFRKLLEADRMLGEGQPMVEVSKHLGSPNKHITVGGISAVVGLAG